MTPRYAFATLDVFTDRRFGGNPLAVFPDARGLSDGDMQALAAEFNLSETAFVLPPEDSANTARVRIFHRTAEMPFAGHPLVGTACVLADAGRDRDGALRLEVPAGVAEVRVDRDAARRAARATVAAPQPLAVTAALPEELVTACAGLVAGDLVVAAHAPVLASVGTPYVLAEVRADALARAAPDVAAFRHAAATHAAVRTRLSLLLYAREDAGAPGRDGAGVRTRMFAPLAGTTEDPATGSANAALAALLLSLTDAPRLAYDATQGVELGRPSRLSLTATRTPGGIRATVGGGCVPVFRGEFVP